MVQGSIERVLARPVQSITRVAIRSGPALDDNSRVAAVLPHCEHGAARPPGARLAGLFQRALDGMDWGLPLVYVDGRLRKVAERLEPLAHVFGRHGFACNHASEPSNLWLNDGRPCWLRPLPSRYGVARRAACWMAAARDGHRLLPIAPPAGDLRGVRPGARTVATRPASTYCAPRAPAIALPCTAVLNVRPARARPPSAATASGSAPDLAAKHTSAIFDSRFAPHLSRRRNCAASSRRSRSRTLAWHMRRAHPAG